MANTLANTLGVKTRWQAFACLSRILPDGYASVMMLKPFMGRVMQMMLSRRTDAVAFSDEATFLRNVAEHFAVLLRRESFTLRDAVAARVSFLNMLADELEAEALERS